MFKPPTDTSVSVLVVEDQPLLLMEAMDLVEDAGLHPYGARRAGEAIDLMERHPEILILFTDVEMPGPMDGLRLAHAVRLRWPAVAIIVTSGRVEVCEDDMPANGIFFAKPYPPETLVKTLVAIASRFAS